MCYNVLNPFPEATRVARHITKHLHIRLFLLTLPIVLLLQLALAALLSNSFSAQFSRQMRERGLDSLTVATYALTNAIKNMDQTAYALAYNQSVQRYLNITDRDSEYDKIMVARQMDGVFNAVGAQSIPGVYFTMYNTAKGGLYSTMDSTYLNKSTTVIEEAWYERFLADPTLRKLFLPSLDIRNLLTNATLPVSAFAYRVNNNNSLQVRGYLVVQFDASTFRYLIGELPSAVSNVFVLDGDGNTLYQEPGFLNFDDLAVQAKGGDIRRGDNGEVYLPLELSMRELNWRIYCTIDATQAAVSLHMLRVTVALGTTLISLLMLAVLYLYMRRVTRPLARMVAGMAGVSMGQYDIRLPVQSSDEIGVLTQSFNDMSARLGDANVKLKRYEALQHSISYYALQQQVNPHFLYNTLDTMIGMATQNDTSGIIQACACLAAMFRYALSTHLAVPLSDEIKHVKNYFAILSLRSCGRIELTTDIDPDAAGMPIPRLSVQTFVENSVKHGFNRRNDHCRVLIRALADEMGRLNLIVQDNGDGFAPESLAELKSALATGIEGLPSRHIGVLNVHARMKLIYGDDFRLSVDNDPEGGAVVRLSLPGAIPVDVI